MRAALIFGSLFSMILLAGCGDPSGPAEPVADLDEITTYFAENPEQDVEAEDEEDMEEDGDE